MKKIFWPTGFGLLSLFSKPKVNVVVEISTGQFLRMQHDIGVSVVECSVIIPEWVEKQKKILIFIKIIINFISWVKLSNYRPGNRSHFSIFDSPDFQARLLTCIIDVLLVRAFSNCFIKINLSKNHTKYKILIGKTSFLGSTCSSIRIYLNKKISTPKAKFAIQVGSNLANTSI